jgi:hypothetical protein
MRDEDLMSVNDRTRLLKGASVGKARCGTAGSAVAAARHGVSTVATNMVRGRLSFLGTSESQSKVSINVEHTG